MNALSQNISSTGILKDKKTKQNIDRIPNLKFSLRSCVVKLRRCKIPVHTPETATEQIKETKKLFPFPRDNHGPTTSKKVLQRKFERAKDGDIKGREKRLQHVIVNNNTICEENKQKSDQTNRATRNIDTNVTQMNVPTTQSTGIRLCKVKIMRIPLGTISSKIAKEMSDEILQTNPSLLTRNRKRAAHGILEKSKKIQCYEENVKLNTLNCIKTTQKLNTLKNKEDYKMTSAKNMQEEPKKNMSLCRRKWLGRVNLSNEVTSEKKGKQSNQPNKSNRTVVATTDAPDKKSPIGRLRKCKVRILRTPLRTVSTPNSKQLADEVRSKNLETSKDPESSNKVSVKRAIQFRGLSSTAINDDQSNTDSSKEILRQPTRAAGKGNLATKSNVIEEILHSDDEIVKLNTQKEKQRTISRTYKFFHKDALKIVNSISENKEKVLEPTMRKRNIKKSSLARKTTQKGKTSVDDVYDFLSQSQTSDSDGVPKNHNDPASDIIQKLIAEGRVAVSTKRKGKLILKRQNGALAKKGEKKQSQKTKSALRHVEVHKPRNASEDTNNEFAFDNHEHIGLEQNENLNMATEQVDQQKAVDINSSNVRKIIHSPPEGTFSPLARSVIMQQAGKTANMERSENILVNKRRLLEIARKFVSTPVVKNKPLERGPELSPIASEMAHQQCSNISPWRICDDSHLPSVFYFSRDSSNMPSISSDFIPADEISLVPNQTLCLKSQTGNPLKILPTDNPTSLSSFSSNDSNAENNPPQQHDNNETDKNAVVFNPRRTINNRSPLKSINILNVVTLPSWKNVETQNKSENTTTEIRANTVDKVDNSDDNRNNLDLFGFEDLIDGDVEDVRHIPCEENNKQNVAHSKRLSLHTKLKNLKKWRPLNDTIAPSVSRSRKPSELLFDENATKSKQRTIKQMLSSTLLQPQRQTESTGLNTYVDAIDSDQEDSEDDVDYDENVSRAQSPAEPDLFDDPDITFNEKVPHRTYGRPNKRKRKPRDFILMHIDSDEDERNHNDQCGELDISNATDDEHYSPTKKHTKRKRTEKNNVELDTFVNNFNNMCKEVEHYELIVE